MEGFGNRIDDAVLRMFPDTYLPKLAVSSGIEEKNDDEKVLIISAPHQESKLPQKYSKSISQRNSSLRQRA